MSLTMRSLFLLALLLLSATLAHAQNDSDGDEYADEDPSQSPPSAHATQAQPSAPHAPAADQQAQQTLTQADFQDEFQDDDYDQDEFEGVPRHHTTATNTPPSAAATASSASQSAPTAAPAQSADTTASVPLQGDLSPDQAAEEADASRFNSQPQGDLAGFRGPQGYVGIFGPDDWSFEIACIAFIVAYLINWLVGSQINKGIAHEWLKTYRSLLDDNFFQVGLGKQGEDVLKSESSSEFRLTATGRINVHCVQMTLDLVGRHDLFAMFMDLFSASHDQLVIDVAVPPQDMPQFVMAITAAKKEKSLRKSNSDIAHFCKTYRTAGEKLNLPSKMILISENEDGASSLINTPVRDAFEQQPNLFEHLYVTDHNPLSTHKQTMRLVLRLPRKNKMADLQVWMDALFALIDQLPNIRLSTNSKTRAKNLRSSYEDELTKQTNEQRKEEAARRLEERKRKQLEEEKEMMKKMDPKQLEKYEASKRKKELRRRTKGSMKVMKQ